LSWIPGWDSVANAGWWSGFYFWASIVALISLGIMEVASHRYSERKEELASIEQEAILRRHDEEMARVQHDTAQANERAAGLEKEAAEARKETAILRKRAAPRTLDWELFQKMMEGVSKMPVEIWYSEEAPDGYRFAYELDAALKAAQWEVVRVIPIPDVPARAREDNPTFVLPRALAAGGGTSGITVAEHGPVRYADAHSPGLGLMNAIARSTGWGGGGTYSPLVPEGILRVIIAAKPDLLP